MVGWLVDLRPSTIDLRPSGEPRFVAAGRKARPWRVPVASYGRGPDEAGPTADHRPPHSAFSILHSAFIGVVGSFDR